ncbi:MAG: response regulator transcription factor [Anaerolineales bacterium]|nr:response regulator transcription factor [Anaerolineales bacterium]
MNAVVKLRALVVEDDRSWQQILGEILTDAGLQVDVVDNLDKARTVLREAAHRVAVVDLSLGGRNVQNQDGLEVLEAIRLLDPQCIAIMLTGYATVELAVNVLIERGAFSCLRKETFNRAQFRGLVDQALASAPRIEANCPSGIKNVKDPIKNKQADPVLGLAPAPGLALIVDNDAGWRNILTELLTDSAFRVAACSSFGEALGWIRREKINLAVVDLSLTGTEMDGYRLLETTRERKITTIVVSGVATPAEIERTYAEYGVFAHLEKQSFNRQTFFQTIELAKTPSTQALELQELTERELEVLELLARGLTNNEIGDSLVISANTVKRHLKAIYKKLDVHTRSAAAAKAINAGLSVE